MTDLGKTISDLETKCQLLDTENVSLRSTSALQEQTISQLSNERKRNQGDRDFYLQQNAELMTLLRAAAALIIDGVNKIERNSDREAAILRARTDGKNQIPRMEPPGEKIVEEHENNG